MRVKERICLLFDNGSVRPAPTLHLREIAVSVGRALGRHVRAVSLLHSDKVSPAELGGEPALLLEQAARAFWQQQPDGEALLVPAFFGPSRAITHYVPQRLRALASEFPHARWQLAPCLVDLKNARDTGGASVAAALAAEARRVIAANNLDAQQTKILLTDHGSPERAVTEVREWLGARVRALLRTNGEGIASGALIGTASMERRDGEKYAFNEPLLERALRTPPFDTGDVIVLLQFLSPGRHAGPDGDIARLCAAAMAERAGLRTWLSEPIGGGAEITDVLRLRFANLLEK